MLNKKQIVEELDRLSAFETVTETYTEIAANRMQRVRDEVVRNREFVEGILEIFQDLRTSYKHQIESLLKSRKVKDISKLASVHNGKTVYVYISANSGLYGDLIRRIYEDFSENLADEKSDLVIIGKMGKTIMAEEGVTRSYTFFELPDDTIDLDAVKKIVAFLVPYEKVIVYYGKFESIITQTPISIDLTGNTISETKNPTKITYLVEPTLEETLTFFATEIFSSVFVQSVHESQLAKFASRMLYMDKANQKIKERIKRTTFEKQRLKHAVSNRKQLQTLGALTQWKP